MKQPQKPEAKPPRKPKPTTQPEKQESSLSPERRAELEAMQPAAGREHRRRRFDEQSLEEYAILAAKRFNDEEICAIMGWNVGTFKVWKSKAKNHSTLANLVTRARAAKLQAHLANIEAAGFGEGAHARADWRASHAILGIMDSSRFGQQRQDTGTVNNTAIVVSAGGEDGLRKLVELFAKQATAQVASSPAPVALPPPAASSQPAACVTVLDAELAAGD
jgi:hypothetical protein